jgi:ABC-2 type transport system ATP-binding protein
MSQIILDRVRKNFVVRKRAGIVRRSRTTVPAVADVSFRIEEGAMVGYIGPNGAGKSTTIKMLTGILVPTSGEVRVLGLDPSRRRVDLARQIGVVFGQRTQLWWDLPLADSFELLHHVYGTDRRRHHRNLAGFTELLELGPFLATPVRQLSLGQRMRGELTAAMLHDPRILFLDEPTIGLDVVSKHSIRTFLQELNRRHNTTILLTTHDLGDIERLCERMLIIDRGHVIHDGSVTDFKAHFGRERLVIVDLEEAGPPVDIPKVAVVRQDGPRQWLRFSRDETTAAEVVATLVRRERVHDLTIEEPNIDDLVREVYLDTNRGRSPR